MNIKIDNMESIPARSNPFLYDHVRMGVTVNDRFVAMVPDSSGRSGEIVIVDTVTGLRKKLTFPTPAKQEKVKSWKNVSSQNKPIEWRDMSPKMTFIDIKI